MRASDEVASVPLPSPFTRSRTVSHAVNALVMGEIFYLFNCRHIMAPLISWSGFFGNRYVLIAIGVLIVIQMLFTYNRVMQGLFGTAAIDLAAWARISAVEAILFILVEIEKYAIRGNRPRALPEVI